MQYEKCRNLDDVLSMQLSSFRIPNDEECTLCAKADCLQNGDWIAHKGDQRYLTGCGGCVSGKWCWSGCAKFWNDRAVSIKCTWPNPKTEQEGDASILLDSEIVALRSSISVYC